MNARLVFAMAAVLIGVFNLPASADDRPATQPSKSRSEKKKDVGLILEYGRAAGTLPSGIVVQVSAHMTRVSSETRRHPAGPEISFKEIWQFAGDRVYRVFEIPSGNGGETKLERAESLPIDTGAVCKDLLDGHLLTIGESDQGDRQIFIDTDYDIGHRSIQILADGKQLNYTGESCVVAGYAEPDARAFAALYERLALRARQAFEKEHAKGANRK